MLMTLLSATNAAGSLLYYTSAYALAGIAARILYVCKTMKMKTWLISTD
jgi:NADH-quinone oxidoreductase subunit N